MFFDVENDDIIVVFFFASKNEFAFDEFDMQLSMILRSNNELYESRFLISLRTNKKCFTFCVKNISNARSIEF